MNSNTKSTLSARGSTCPHLIALAITALFAVSIYVAGGVTPLP